MTEPIDRHRSARGTKRPRLDAANAQVAVWRKWQTYPSERRRETIREDASRVRGERARPHPAHA